MKCVACLQGTPWECREQGECGDGQSPEASKAIGTFTQTSNHSSSDMADRGDDSGIGDLRTYKDDSALRDQQSTGRKRAARLYPLEADAPCEWQMKKNCGGGNKPIVGCMNGVQQARHHGPDKNTLNNESGNVHRICHTCHNRWHTLNDDGYVWGNIYPLHNPMEAQITDIGMNEVFWDGRKLVKAKD